VDKDNEELQHARHQHQPRTTSRRRLLVARIYDDEQLSANGDLWRPGECIWESRHTIDDDTANWTSSSNYNFDSLNMAAISAKANFSVTLSNVRLWSSELPNLYTFTISLYDAEDTECQQSESCRLGFRSVDIRSPGVVYINDQRIKSFSGVNRHEHDPDFGKVVSFDRMKQDLCLLKYVCFAVVSFCVNISSCPMHLITCIVSDKIISIWYAPVIIRIILHSIN
jgi:beta-galactosidase/beta-glucuronidase